MLGAAALVGACQRSQPVDATKPLPEPLRPVAQQQVQSQAPTVVTEAKKAPSPSPAPAKPAASKPPAVKPAPATAPVSAREADTQAAAAQPKTKPDSEDAEKRDDDEPIVTTISGCLEKNRSRFRLTDMIGEHAPKSRSWKTGFFRKGSAKLDLVDETNRLKLAPHVGYRVDVTGALFKKALHARSVSPTTARCS
jgi:hypothetical protein